MRKKKLRYLMTIFFSVCQIENGDAALPSMSAFQNSKYLANISTSEQEINILLRNVDLSKACGSDGIGNFILKICAEYIADPLCNVYNMSGRVVSDIQTRAEGESLYIRYNTDANVVNNLKNDPSYEFIGEVILKINVV